MNGFYTAEAANRFMLESFSKMLADMKKSKFNFTYLDSSEKGIMNAGKLINYFINWLHY